MGGVEFSGPFPPQSSAPFSEAGHASGVGFPLPLSCIASAVVELILPRAAPMGPSRSQNLPALDNVLLFLNDPHPSGEGMRKPPGKVLCASGDQVPGRRKKLGSLLGVGRELVPWGH